MAKNLNMAEFKRLYEEWQDSHLNIRDYCSSIGISEDRFYYWKRKLTEAELPAAPTSFVPIQMSQRGGKISISNQSAPSASLDKESYCEIVYQNGVVLKVKSEMSLAALRSLILLCQ